MSSIYPPAVHAELKLQRALRERALELVDADNVADATPELRRQAWLVLKGELYQEFQMAELDY